MRLQDKNTAIPIPSIATIASSAAGIVHSGSADNPPNILWNGGVGGSDFTWAGTKLVMPQVQNTGTNGFSFDVDGAVTIPTIPANTVTSVTIVDSPFQVTRRIKVRALASGGLCQINKASFATITGNPPSITQPYEISSVAAVKSSLSIVNDQTMFNVNFGGQLGTYPAGQGNSRIRFKATCSAIWIFSNSVQTSGAPFPLSLYIDGVYVRTTFVDGTVYNWVQIADGLDNTTEHTYSVECEYFAALWAPFTVGVQGTINGATLTAKAPIVFYGDSLTAPPIISGTGTPSGAVPVINGWPSVVAAAKNRSCGNQGLFNRTVRSVSGGNDPGGTHCGVNDTGLVTQYTTAAAVVILMGINDANNLYGSTWNQASFITAYTTMLANIRAVLTTIPIVCLGTSDTLVTPAATNNASCRAGIQSAVTAGGAGVSYYALDSLIDPSSPLYVIDTGANPLRHTVDNLHFWSPVGQQIIATAVNAALTAAGIT